MGGWVVADIVFALAAAKGPCEAVDGGGLTESEVVRGGMSHCNCRSNSSADISAAIVLPPRSMFFGATHVVGQCLRVACCREILKLLNFLPLSSLFSGINPGSNCCK